MTDMILSTQPNNKINGAKQRYLLQSNISIEKLTFGTWLMVNT